MFDKLFSKIKDKKVLFLKCDSSKFKLSTIDNLIKVRELSNNKLYSYVVSKETFNDYQMFTKLVVKFNEGSVIYIDSKKFLVD